MATTFEHGGPIQGAHELLDHITAQDGVPPISDPLLIATHSPSGSWSDHAVTTGVRVDGKLVGFGVIAPIGKRSAVEFVIAPEFRGRGLGRQLADDQLRTIESLGIADRTWPWSHGDFPAAAAMASALGYTKARVLLQLSTQRIDQPGYRLPQVAVPDDIALRPYEPGDEARWRDINNAAFDWHPEQSDRDLSDFTAIVADPAFTPEDVLFATDGSGEVVGFHQTSIRTKQPSGLRVGETTVIGVDPAAHARGVGTALMLAGMEQMQKRGAQILELYVESDNRPARKLYDKLGYVNEIRHVSYRPPGQPEEPADDVAGAGEGAQQEGAP